MLTVATCLWDANEDSRDFSRCYDETWVARLAAGFRRNLTQPYRFVLFTERERDLGPSIGQEMLSTGRPSYANFVEPFRLGEPMILVGLDTVITGNIDHFADYCLTATDIALPRNPKKRHVSCNGVALVPAGHRRVYDDWRGENDMEWMEQQPHVFIDDLFPGQVLSAKVQVRRDGFGDARIVYFHGVPKPHQMQDVDWVRKHWLGKA